MRAHAVMQQARTLAPEDAAMRLVGANTCYGIHYVSTSYYITGTVIFMNSQGWMVDLWTDS